jgi:hypothetical protein
MRIAPPHFLVFFALRLWAQPNPFFVGSLLSINKIPLICCQILSSSGTSLRTGNVMNNEVTTELSPLLVENYTNSLCVWASVPPGISVGPWAPMLSGFLGYGPHCY